MIYLLLGILSSTLIVVLFKTIAKKNIKLLPIIVFNYITATVLGLLLNKVELDFGEIVGSSWFVGAIFIGALFIIGFFLIGYATQKIGISITTISNKMSVVIPILFSIIYFKEEINLLKIVGIVLALIAITLASYRKRQKDSINLKYIYLPIFLFLSIGSMDSLVKLSQSKFDESIIPVFTAVTFGIAGIIGIIISFFAKVRVKNYFNTRTILHGILLGLLNYGSLFFLVLALSTSGLDSSIVFGINNIGVIILSIIVAFAFFKEKITLINLVGIIISIVSIIIFFV